MKFLVDAQLPRRLALSLKAMGYDALHTLDLADGNRTTDEQINIISEDEQRIVITKDADFVNSFLLEGRPFKLLLISTGNIRNPELEALLLSHITTLTEVFEVHRYVELSRAALIIHD